MNQATPSRIEFANTLRGLAALCVVVHHYGYFFWHERAITGLLINAPSLDASVSEAPACLQWLGFLWPIELGQFGVGLFYLLSGFVIPFSFQRSGWRGFALGRILRIYPTYAAGFACTLAAIYFCGTYFDRPFPHEMGAVLPHFLPGLQDILLTPSIDGIIWTLNVEMKFYLVCVLASALLSRGSRAVFLVPMALTACAVTVAMMSANRGGHWTVAMTMLCLPILFINLMFIGVAFNYWDRRLLKPSLALAEIGMLILAMAVVWWSATPIPLPYAWSYGLAVLAFGLCFFFSDAQVLRGTRLSEYFADISYPLYVVHGVAGYASMRLLLEASWPPAAAMALTLCATLGLATLIHRFVEQPSHRLGRRLARSGG